MAAQAVMGTWLVAAIFFGVHVKPGATHNITMNGARIGMPAILPIAGHNMRFVSRTPMKEKARTLGVPAKSAKWSMRDFGRYVVAAVWKPCVSELMNLTALCEMQTINGTLNTACRQTVAWHMRDNSWTRKNIRPLNIPARVAGLTGIKNITHQA